MVVVDADTLNSRVEGSDPGCGPVSFGDVAMLAFRADIYGAVRDQRNVTINFGRFRRFASTLQRVAVIARDGTLETHNDRHRVRSRQLVAMSTRTVETSQN